MKNNLKVAIIMGSDSDIEIFVETAKILEEFGVPYLENKTLADALRSHLQTLKNLGRLPDINEALAG